MNEIKLNVVGMHCGGCAMNVRGALESVPGVISAEVDHKNGIALVHYKEHEPSAESLIASVTKAGYKATLSS